MKNLYDDMPNGYQETIEKGMNAVRYFTRSMSYGKGSKEEQIKRLLQEIKEADAIVIGAGAGLSTSAGLTYSGKRFEKYFYDFAKRFGIRDMYSGGFYPFPSEEIRWAWWARHIYFNRYIDAPKPVYRDLLKVVSDKDYFVITTNVDHQFQRAGFDKKRLFYTQGDYGLFQSVNPDIQRTFDINAVEKDDVPDHNLLVGGFPCQDYSVASSLATSKGLEGKKGVLWWDIRDMLEVKKAPLVLLENVDRLIKSPAKQRGRDFGMILACFRDLGYSVEWRVINAAEYGYQQRRRRTFIFAYSDDTNYAKRVNDTCKYNKDDVLENKIASAGKLIFSEGFFAKSFHIGIEDNKKIKTTELPKGIGDLSENFKFLFENTGIMKDGVIYTTKTSPKYDGNQITLGDIMEGGDIPAEFFVPEDRLYYTSPEVDHSDETQERLSAYARKTWQYIKGAKKLPRTAANGHEYIFSEGPVAMIDEYDRPARTMLTSEGGFSRTTHIVRDKKTQKIRLLTPIEMERIQGFPSDWTKECLVAGEKVEMPLTKRRFMMGNALVVNLVAQMEKQLSDIFDAE